MGFLTEFRNQFLLNEVSIDQLRHDWVDSGRMSADIFNACCICADNKSAYVTWLVKKIGDDIISSVSVTDSTFRDWFKRAFVIFDRFKARFEKKDINQYKTLEDVGVFLRKAQEIQDAEEKKKRQRDVDRFKIGAVQCDNKVYLVYKLPKGHEENHQISVELGKTDHGRFGGSGWCTASGNHPDYWKSHIQREDLYIFVNPQDKKFDKYQIQFGYCDAKAFPVTTDQVESDEDCIKHKPFYDFLHEKEGRPYPKCIQEIFRCQEYIEKAKEVNLSDLDEDIVFSNDTGKLYRFVKVNGGADRYVPYILRMLLSVEQLGKEDLMKNVVLFIKDAYAFLNVHSIAYCSNCSEGNVVFWSKSYDLLIPHGNVESISREHYELVKEYANRVGFEMFSKLVHRFAPTYSAEQAKKGTISGVTVYIFPGNVNISEAFSTLTGDDGSILNSETESFLHGVAILVLEKGKKAVLTSCYRETAGIGRYFMFDSEGRYIQEEHNFDVYYSWWKVAKHFDEDIVFPTKIAAIDRIKTGGLRDYEIQPIGEFTKIYKVPGDEANDLIPYPKRHVTDPTYLCYINKWQVTLSTTGDFFLIGRHGESSSVSWIQSVKGLGESLKALCDREQLLYPDTLCRWWEKYKGSYPRREEPAQQTPQQQQQTEEPSVQRETNNVVLGDVNERSMYRRLNRGNDLIEQTVSYFTRTGREKTMNVTGLVGPYSQFRNTFVACVGGTTEYNERIWNREGLTPGTTHIFWYHGITGDTWNCIIELKNDEGAVVATQIRSGHGIGTQWTLTFRGRRID